MKLGNLVYRSLNHYWKAHLGVFLGSVVGTAVLVGALGMGDCLSASLRYFALDRLGSVDLALETGGRFFRTELAAEMSDELNCPVVSCILLRASTSTPDRGARANRVQLIGVNDDFPTLWHLERIPLAIRGDEVVVNRSLADQLDIKVGENLIVRVEKPSGFSREAPLTSSDDSQVALRTTVKSVVPDEGMGRFSLHASQIAPFNISLSLSWLQAQLDIADRANCLLVSNYSDLESAEAALKRTAQLTDYLIELRELPDHDSIELRSPSVFVSDALVQAVQQDYSHALGLFTYLVNEIRLRNQATPYSLITGLGMIGNGAHPSMLSSLVPQDMRDDEIVINQWLADDLGARPGDEVVLEYLTMGAGRLLESHRCALTVRSIIPIEGLAADPEMMPLFPGLQNTDSCRDWDPGFSIDLDRIRPKDEMYWQEHQGTPKGFVTLRKAQQLWGNRFGNVTAIRLPLPTIPIHDLEREILGRLKPSDFGMFFAPVRSQALEAALHAVDFGPLFLGFSFFLIGAALVLMGMIFAFGIEQRAEEVGTLLALGFSIRTVRRLLLLEGFLVTSLGSFVGSLCGVGYARLMLVGLQTVWSDAVGRTDFLFFVSPWTLVVGFSSGVALSLVVVWWVVIKQARAPIRLLLATGQSWQLFELDSKNRTRLSTLAPLVFLSLAALTITIGLGREGVQSAGVFFAAGSLLLATGISLASSLLGHLASTASLTIDSTASLSLRDTTRRRGRSLATIALIAFGSFVVVAVGANRRGSVEDFLDRSSGTGGFAVYAESALSVTQHPANILEQVGLSEGVSAELTVLPMRVRDGEDASCLNLNRAQSPRIIGVNPDPLSSRHSFSFTKTVANSDQFSGWNLLKRDQPNAVVPAIGDEATVIWGLGKSVGDKLTYLDDQGGAFDIVIVGLVKRSILQGSLFIAEDAFLEHFPSESGYRAFLFDCPLERRTEFISMLSQAFQDAGMEVTTTESRLSRFDTVENTYLEIFLTLGGLGVILGISGLGVVVMRNAFERRSEFALLQAVGFPRRTIRFMVLCEHAFLISYGLLCGTLSGLVALIPRFTQVAPEFPWLILGLHLSAMFSCGILCAWFASAFVCSGSILDALRGE